MAKYRWRYNGEGLGDYVLYEVGPFNRHTVVGKIHRSSRKSFVWKVKDKFCTGGWKRGKVSTEKAAFYAVERYLNIKD